MAEPKYLDLSPGLSFQWLHSFYSDLQPPLLLAAGSDGSGGLRLLQGGHGDPCLCQSGLGEDRSADGTRALLCSNN